MTSVFSGVCPTLRTVSVASALVLSQCLLAGCGGDAAPPADSTTVSDGADGAGASDGAGAGSGSRTTPGPGGRPIQRVSLGGATTPVEGEGTASAATLSEAEQQENARQALKPLQVVVGQWRGTARRKNSEGFNFTDEFEWRWDFSGGKPALLMTGSGSTYFKEARISWLPAEQEFELNAIDKDDEPRRYRGQLSEPVRREPGEDKRTHTTFRLTFNQVEPADDRKLVRVELKQQQNDRYLLTVYNGSSTPRLYDTIAGQRQGTSFAKADDDYGDRECIVSQGLGTMSVSFQGKTYYVCCSGCRAAFEEEPERWIAKAAAREKAEKK